ncbi:hypothetical protein OHV05_35275 (plasmid) [Kitasatospora sp. NBC_00070]|uniref:hypothetical protein n=1 Tax=Kitasatospora sp. NBC_00070 TaxID=2975962 RepID=UPI002F914F5B
MTVRPYSIAPGEAGRQELLDLAAAVRRTAARFLESLEEATVGEGDDPSCVRALERLEASLNAVTAHIVRKAHRPRLPASNLLELAGESSARTPHGRDDGVTSPAQWVPADPRGCIGLRPIRQCRARFAAPGRTAGRVPFRRTCWAFSRAGVPSGAPPDPAPAGFNGELVTVRILGDTVRV